MNMAPILISGICMLLGSIASANEISLEAVSQKYERFHGAIFLHLSVRSNQAGKLVVLNNKKISAVAECGREENDSYSCAASVPAPSGLAGFALTEFFIETQNGQRSRMVNLLELL